jgi:hypothetical protein
MLPLRESHAITPHFRIKKGALSCLAYAIIDFDDHDAWNLQIQGPGTILAENLLEGTRPNAASVV